MYCSCSGYEIAERDGIMEEGFEGLDWGSAVHDGLME
jgi:hypothetical protein